MGVKGQWIGDLDLVTDFGTWDIQKKIRTAQNLRSKAVDIITE